MVAGLRCSLFQQNAREHVVKNHDQDDGIDDGLRDRAANSTRPADGRQALVTRDNSDDQRKAKTLNTPLATSFNSTTSRKLAQKA